MDSAMKRLLAPLLIPPLMACAADTTNYPSLARRDAEKVADSAPVAVAPVGPVSADNAAHLSTLVDQARSAHQSFNSRQAKAERAVSAGGTVGSESWGTASIALADLESARSDAMIALADLDGLYAAARIAGSDAAAIIVARDQVSTLVRQEDAVLARLRGQLRR
jgi:hypothetical protein